MLHNFYNANYRLTFSAASTLSGGRLSIVSNRVSRYSSMAVNICRDLREREGGERTEERKKKRELELKREGEGKGERRKSGRREEEEVEESKELRWE